MTSPAVEVRSFAATIPAGTALATPATVDIFFPARTLTAIHWKVPPGPSGLMGWRLTMSGGNPVIPTGGGWIITDNDSDTWPVIDMPDSGQWEVTGYNTDIYPHTIYLDFLLDLVGQAAAPPPLIPNTSVGSPGVVTTITTPLLVTTVSIPAVTVPPPLSTPPPVTVVQPVFITTPQHPAPPPPPKVPPQRLVQVPVTIGERADTALAKIRSAGFAVSTSPARSQSHAYVSAGSVPEGGSSAPAGSHVTLNVRVA